MARSKVGPETVTCPECECSLKDSNLSEHLSRVHGIKVRKPESAPKVASKGKRAERRKLELKRRKRTRNISIAVSLFIIVLAAVAVYLATDNNSPGPSPQSPPPKQVQNSIQIPVAELGASAQFYSYNSGTAVLRYFAAVGPDGNVHVAMDACDVCYSEKKGYRQVGDVMKCNNCGKEFAINSIGTENLSGGCWPSYVPVTVSGGSVTIQLTDLSAKGYMFA